MSQDFKNTNNKKANKQEKGGLSANKPASTGFNGFVQSKAHEKNSKSERNRRMLSFSDGIGRLIGRRKGSEEMRLTRLWMAWNEVLGDDLAMLVKPLGRRERTLLLGVEDSMVMQEAHYHLQLIMQKVNDFLGDMMGGHYFEKAQLSLPKGKQGLDAYQGLPTLFIYTPVVPEPPDLENVVGKLNPESPVGRCFNAYYHYFKTRDKS